MEALTIIMSNTTLKSAFEYVVRTNKSNAAPYHNLRHLLFMVEECDSAAEHHKVTGALRVNLLLAALFHDYNHSAGKLSDSDNIKNAFEGFLEWHNTNNLGVVNISVVKSLIEATEYPYTIDSLELNLVQGIIRDADLMMSTEYDWLNTVIVGLGVELNQNCIKNMSINQLVFLKGVKMNTDWGKKEWSRKSPNVFIKFKQLIDLL